MGSDIDLLTEDYYEYEQGEKQILVKGRLCQNVNFWREIGASEFIIDTIRFGYKIPFFSTPPTSFLGNNKSALLNSEFVEEAIGQLVKKGLVETCKWAPYVVNPLSVSVQQNGKKRLILDLRVVNMHIWKEKVKFEDIRTALMYVRKGAWMFKFDIHSAYHHVDIFPEHTQFLGFSWEIGGKRIFYKFLVLPFGIRSAPFLFTKLTRPLIGKWRSEGLHILMYLDDGLGCHTVEKVSLNQAIQVKADLLASGFVPKADKSLWEPVQRLVFLGVDIDTMLGILSIPDYRIVKARSCLRDLLSVVDRGQTVHVRKVAKFVGHIISMSIVMGNITQLMTRSLSLQIATSKTWNEKFSLGNDSVVQLRFWLDRLDGLNSCEIRYSPQCNRIVYSDASSLGYGGYCVESPCGVSQGLWSCSESTKSSTWRELKAVYRVMCALFNSVAGQRVKWFTDNQSVVAIVEKGSMKVDLQLIAMDIYDLCWRHSIVLEIVWTPRSENERADYLSKISDPDDWGVSMAIFGQLERLWGPYEADWFASHYNAKHKMFFSKFWNPGSSGMDAFTFDWGGKNGWFVPPVYLITRVILYMEACKAYGTLIVPVWKTGRFWPILCPCGSGFITAVKDARYLPTGENVCVQGRGSNNVFTGERLHFRMLALYLDFR